MLTTKVHSLVTASFSLSPCFKQATFSLAVTDGLRYCRSPLTPSLRELGASRRAGVFARAAVALGIRHKHTLTHKILTCGISPHLHFNTKKPKKPQKQTKKKRFHIVIYRLFNKSPTLIKALEVLLFLTSLLKDCTMGKCFVISAHTSRK